ncbi:WHG domain-containing protein [Actinomycetospora chiangmaiensis]|uniref:TetR/AcrR family transcriptional regulator n=1 Tax=Actinomycetospora chiangmaiensis TaxID=402650 RepID=UPI00036CE7E4
MSTERLVRSGAELADEVGFEQVTLSALARRHGVRLASLYAHVANSADLKSRICGLALTEMADLASAALAGRAGRDALVALGGVYRDYARRFPGRFRASEFRLTAEAAAAGAGVRHAELARAVLRGYGLPESEEVHAVRLLGSVLRGYIDLEQAGSFDHSEPDPAQSWSWTLDALDALLRSRATTTPATPEGTT